MGKKRIHELAKELGLENREVLERLQAAGISAKTHSSSVDEEEARAALEAGAKPAAGVPKPPVGRPGMMIVRKRERIEEEANAAAAAIVPPAAPAHLPTPTPETEAPDLYETAPAGESEVAQSEAAPEGAPSTDAIAPPAAAIATSAAGPATGSTAAPGSARVLRIIDREKLLERVPSRRLGGEPAGAPKFGRVTELQVVTDPFGRGREMIDLARDKKGKPALKVVKKGKAPTKREMMEMRERSMHPARLKKKRATKGGGKKTELTQKRASKRVIRIRDTIVVSDLARQIGVKVSEILERLARGGAELTANDVMDLETAQLLASEFEYTVESVAFTEGSIIAAEEEEAPEDLQPRPPVVTVMGHVDHGKTSLLDFIRKSSVAAKEAGGITQHIGAYSVQVGKRGTITFLDTPGHAAFTNMRARGAQVTDLVVLVVAADDGVMPQTEEAIKHAQAAEVPIIVALNKADRAEANPEKVMQDMMHFGLVSESLGGETMYVPTSATKGTGIPELLETILLQAEVLELGANPDAPAIGTVIEAQLDKGRGPVATILVNSGTLRRGDAIVVGEHAGKIRAMVDDAGRPVNEVRPGFPVEIIGLEGVPDAGDVLNAVENADAAREVAEHRAQARREKELAKGQTLSLEDMMQKMQATERREVKVVLKADVQGSVEAVKQALTNLSTDEVRCHVLFGGVGAIKESDIMLAAASDGIVLGFGVRPDANARAIAEREGVEVRTYRIIYELLDDTKKAMEGLLAPEQRERVSGRAEVREVFKVAKVGQIAGCRVVEGKAQRSSKIRVVRDGVTVHEGRVSSLKHFKDDVREVESGLECGVGIEGFNDVKNGDVLEFYSIQEVARTFGAGDSGTASASAAHA